MNSSQEILGKLLHVGNDFTNTSFQDVALATSIFMVIVDKTMLCKASSPQLEAFLEVNSNTSAILYTELTLTACIYLRAVVYFKFYLPLIAAGRIPKLILDYFI
jgi:hypothetical protein